MSVKVRKAYVCDLCADEMDVHESTAIVGMAEYVTRPRNAIHFHYGLKADLCDACAQPLIEALERRVAELAAKGRFKPPGSQTPEK